MLICWNFQKGFSRVDARTFCPILIALSMINKSFNLDHDLILKKFQNNFCVSSTENSNINLFYDLFTLVQKRSLSADISQIYTKVTMSNKPFANERDLHIFNEIYDIKNINCLHLISIIFKAFLVN